MFGMGFAEIIIIAIIAVIFLGPDKLPETMVNIAKFFKSLKSTVASAKDSLEQELNISELKKEALSYKEDLMSASNELERVTSGGSLSEELNQIKQDLSDVKNSVTGNSAKSSPAQSQKIGYADDAKPAEKIAQPTPSRDDEQVSFEKKKKEPEDNA
ncbi:MAG: Sec-independent protein translocase subunit TatB [Campylobacterales bacterium]|nr:Sec-independent protein translocase subunit TatB [Campylobacterales bacterium]